MKQTIQILLTVLFTNVSVLYSQNIMQIQNASGYTNDTIELTVEIINDIPFISFQFDVVMPETFSYVPNTAVLTNRSLDHVVNVTEISDHRLRILSYSLNNSNFFGNSGPITKFSLKTGEVEGDFDIQLQQVIIGDSLSQNIADSTINGIVSVYLSGVEDILNPINNIQMYPNPCNGILNIKFQLQEKAEVLLESYNILSKEKNHILLGVFSPGIHTTRININNNDKKTIPLTEIYRLTIKKDNNYIPGKSIKIINY